MVRSNSGGKLYGGTGSGSKTGKGNLQSTPCLRKLRVAYFGFHFLSLLIGVTGIFLGIWVDLVETKNLKDLQLEKGISDKYSTVYYIAGGCIIIAGVLGGLALWKENVPYLWTIYTVLMAVVCLVLFTVSISALTHNFKSVNRTLQGYMETYMDLESAKPDTDTKAIIIIDDMQEHNQCCGIESYKDWQNYAYGKTSLKVPRSCCNIKSTDGTRLIRSNAQSLTANNSELAEEYKYCGNLCLPDSDNLDVIFTRGCKDPLTMELKLIIMIIGSFGLLTSILAGGLFVLSCYLVVWKKI